MANSKEKLRQIVEKIAKEQDYDGGQIDIKEVTSDGANFTTTLYTIDITKPAKPVLNLFAKVANLGQEIRSKSEMLAKVYLVEAIFYTKMAVYFKKLYLKYNVPEEHRLPIPKYYGHVLTPFEETLILENLVPKGFVNFDRMKIYDWEYAAASIKQMTKIHALGWILKEEYPAEFEEMINEMKSERPSNNEASNKQFTQVLSDSFDAVSKEYADRLRNFFYGKHTFVSALAKYHDEKRMLVHGDYRSSNLMHRRKNGKLEVIPLDYQTLRIGYPAAELLQFIWSGSDEEFRRQHYQRLLDYYYTELGVELKRFDLDIEKLYPKEIHEKDLAESQPFALLLGLTMAGIMTVNPEDAPKLENDIGDMTVRANDLAKERIRGVVNDFVRWNIL